MYSLVNFGIKRVPKDLLPSLDPEFNGYLDYAGDRFVKKRQFSLILRHGVYSFDAIWDINAGEFVEESLWSVNDVLSAFLDMGLKVNCQLDPIPLGKTVDINNSEHFWSLT